MIFMGKRALEMSPVAKERNHLMKQRTLACAQPYDEKKCKEATRILEEFNLLQKEARKR